MKQIKSILKILWPFGTIVALCFWTILPLFHSGFFPMHDDEQVARLFEMVQVLGQGQIPPRWVPDLGFGYGYPLFNFYPPFVYYLGALFHAIGTSYIVATKMVMGTGFILSAWFMYLWIKNRFGKLAGFFAAFLYTFVPYHAVDVYVRGALSDFFSFVFIPGMFWALDRLAKKTTRGNIVLASVFLCLIVLTHTLLTLQFFPFLVLYMGYLLYEERKSFKKVFLSFLLISLLGFGLSAYFAVPSVLEKQYTLVDSILTKELANYAIHFVCPMQLWNSPWGYGGSIAGCVDGLSFQAGKVQILLSLIAIFISLASILIKKKQQAFYGLFLGLLFVFSLFMTTNFSKPIWDTIQPLSYIQFPWRFLLFAALFSSALGGYLVFVLKEKINKKILIVFLVSIAVVNFYLVRNDFKPQSYMLFNDNHYVADNDIQWRVSGLSYEYVPKQVATRLSVLHTTELAIDKKDIPTSAFTVISGKMSVEISKNSAVSKQFSITAENPGILQINTYSFPGWEVWLDGRKVSYMDNNRLHLLQINLPVGKHIVDVKFINTPIRTMSNVVSILSVLTLIGIYFLPRRQKSKQA